MRVLGIETSCDETGVAIVDTAPWEAGEPAGKGLLGQALYSQIAMHVDYGGVVPELASRDHIKRVIPLINQTLNDSNTSLNEIDAIAFTQGPGLAGALLVGASIAKGLALSMNKPVLGIHHLEGHLLSPLLAKNANIQFPFVALLVSGGHTQLMEVKAVGEYTILGETLDDAAGEAFDKTAKLLGLSYPGGPAVSKLAEIGDASIYQFPRPMKHSGDLDFSFAGLKTSVLTQVKKLKAQGDDIFEAQKASIARGFVDAIVEVLVSKSIAALKQTGHKTLVVAGGVGANTQLRQGLETACAQAGYSVHYPPLELCTDNGAMIAFAGAMRLRKNPQLAKKDWGFDVRPRWPLDQIG
ncbi:tRNA (adenosine(37)-N6)-threonylcarbamoyltransferase complex transferase subunit TsaD [Polynucleobacter sp. MWH-Spelu-300-X4]|uniref:tRNA (adenosine(37)-N6)-threonylcarbamoyltransferase complex transferase subunit TsaD n=1 Tax=Polynucleobacter sp. MWH-Spelu-300-X4 TaxID=2689109 RepID=UPI001BFCDC60|nr:tRNA (adenosine(37)-N6)-threonylcarbamoyltransferase complex transferase subunit TsaD [Polynucleobacter sp. MWH-Spelu-300-X4]QWD79462.1 tRNA (adenosine(37)-N6)-threonylcarbamoyltransferase complex transferase subunit TsaD [Polynucleobacter sp. MWH-Spelu-300-X4]